MKTLIVALAFVAASPSFAGNYTTMPLGGGWSVTTGDDGTSITTMPLGGGWSTSSGTLGGQPYSATTMPLGGGWSTTTTDDGE